MEQKKIQHHAAHHAVIVRRKLTALIAFTTTMFLLCVENGMAFTPAPLSAHHGILNENTLLLMASGAHSLAKRWNTSTGESNISIRLAASRLLSSPQHAQTAFPPISNVRAQRNSLTSLRMAFSFGMPPPSVPMLDMKTSLNAFGGWYTKVDPVARPPVYDE